MVAEAGHGRMGHRDEGRQPLYAFNRELLYSGSDLVASGRYDVASTSQVVRKAAIVINPIVDVIWQ